MGLDNMKKAVAGAGVDLARVDLRADAHLLQGPPHVDAVVADGVARGEGGHDLDDTTDHEGSGAGSRRARSAFIGKSVCGRLMVRL